MDADSHRRRDGAVVREGTPLVGRQDQK